MELPHTKGHTSNPWNRCPKRGLMTTGGQIPIEKHHRSFIHPSSEAQMRGCIIVYGLKVWCMVSCTTPVNQSECTNSRSTSTKGNSYLSCPDKVLLSRWRTVLSALTLLCKIQLKNSLSLSIWDVKRIALVWKMIRRRSSPQSIGFAKN